MTKLPESQRILIRQLESKDSQALFEMYSDKVAMKYRGSKPFESFEEVAQLLETVARNIENGTEFRYAVVEKETQQLVGTYLYAPISKTACKVGLSFGKAYWRSGLGSEVMILMAEYLKSLGYEKLVGYIKPENIPSIKMVEKLNYIYEEFSEYPEFLKYVKSI